jgi:streptogramin lyase
MNRREMVAFAAATAIASPRFDPARVRVRKTGKVQIVFDSPVPAPNGLQATQDGLWIIDQGAGSRACLASYETGKALRSFETETDRPSGITFDGEALWIGSTYSREIVRCSAANGKTIEHHFTPGAGVIYRMTGDPAARVSPLAKSRPKTAVATGTPAVGGYQAGDVLGSKALGTGAHGQEWRDRKLWFAVPPSREVYRVDPKTWTVELKFPTAGNRPHGIGWEGRHLWVTDSNLNAFFKHDPETGEIREKIQLADSDPLPHGMTIWQGWLWYCDDVGVVCRLNLS